MQFDYYWPKKSLKTNKNELKNAKKEQFLNDFSTKNNDFEEKNKSDTETKEKRNFDVYQTKNDLSGINHKNGSQIESKNTMKKEKLAALRKKKMEDTSIIFANQGNNFVFEDGNPDSDLMFIGEAPGEEEDRKMLPFVGRSGQLLRCFLREANIKDFYITNIISWRPPNNRTPTTDEILSMQPYIFEHIKIINPKIIVAVGTTSLKALNISETITKTQGRIFENEIGRIYPIYHPSYALRVSSKKKELWISLLNLTSIL